MCLDKHKEKFKHLLWTFMCIVLGRIELMFIQVYCFCFSFVFCSTRTQQVSYIIVQQLIRFNEIFEWNAIGLVRIVVYKNVWSQRCPGSKSSIILGWYYTIFRPWTNIHTADCFTDHCLRSIAWVIRKHWSQPTKLKLKKIVPKNHQNDRSRKFTVLAKYKLIDLTILPFWC